ncbi:MAG: ATP-binding cassette domain-containing protein, partial [Cyanobacteria bacterium P01_A01_bin.114]
MTNPLHLQALYATPPHPVGALQATHLPPNTLLHADNLVKGFTLHNQGGIHLSVLGGVSLTVKAGECVALSGASGSGKSTFMRSLYGNYRIDSGS